MSLAEDKNYENMRAGVFIFILYNSVCFVTRSLTERWNAEQGRKQNFTEIFSLALSG